MYQITAGFAIGIRYNILYRLKGVTGISVIYIDLLFIINAITTYVILSVSALISGEYLPHKRHIFSSLLSGFLSVIAFFIPESIVPALIMRLTLCLVIVWSAFKARGRNLFRLSGIFFITSLAAGGVVMMLSLSGMKVSLLSGGIVYSSVSYTILIAAFFIIYAAFRIIFARRGMSGSIVSVEAYFGEKCLRFPAMVDSGNLLTEPVTQKSVILISPSLFAGITPEGRDYPIFITTATEKFAIIHGFNPDKLIINGRAREDFMIAVSDVPIRGIQGTQAIAGGTVWNC